ncbi:MAG: PAS domain S-box protein [Bacteroidia bacterium]|nr:PAS domain S-box protein [Bacteroidia bacterium]
MAGPDILSILNKDDDLTFKNSQRYKELIENSALWVFELDVDGKFIAVNNAGIEEMEAKNQSDLIGVDFASIPEAESSEKITKLINQAWKGKIIDLEFKTKTFKSNDKHFKAKLIPLKDQDNKVFRILGIAEDVSRMNDLLEKLGEREEHFRDIVELSPIAIGIHSDGLMVYVNQAALNLFNAKSVYEVIGKPAIDLVHPDYKKIVQKRLNKITKKGETLPLIEEKFITLDGQIVDVEVTGKYIKYNGKDATLSLIRDITEQKKAEKALIDSEKKYSDLVKENPDAIVSLDSNGCFLSFNPAAEILTGSTSKNVMGKSFEDAKLLKPKSLERALREFTLISSGKDRKPFELEINNVRKPWIIAEANPKLIKQKNGENIVQFTLREITERKLMEEELKKSNEELAAFMYRASHDLRAPLRSLLGLIDLIKMEKDATVADQYIQHMLTSVSKLDNSIEDLLAVTNANKVNPDIVKINFKEIVKNSLKILRNLENHKMISFNMNINSKISFYSDVSFLETIFDNVISNAIKYHKVELNSNQRLKSVSNKRIGNSYVKINVRTYEKEARIKIEDNGLGIDDAVKDKVFDMFYRGSDRSFGTGLGLYIVKNTVGRLRGTIDLKTELGKGTTILIRIPNNDS